MIKIVPSVVCAERCLSPVLQESQLFRDAALLRERLQRRRARAIRRFRRRRIPVRTRITQFTHARRKLTPIRAQFLRRGFNLARPTPVEFRRRLRRLPLEICPPLFESLYTAS